MFGWANIRNQNLFVGVLGGEIFFLSYRIFLGLSLYFLSISFLVRFKNKIIKFVRNYAVKNHQV
jgi:hypothetical protein